MPVRYEAQGTLLLPRRRVLRVTDFAAERALRLLDRLHGEDAKRFTRCQARRHLGCWKAV